ncbi:ABC transporter permease [Pseudoclavibacter helvolus]|uniref:Transport permease protein n=1 Tax=Pseudoclavibacter helvolus TaxID=255205 RepID=A0A7W4UQU0_9MICO|nr:ABC transporter permease [Pseudoclavibacter helvolus]MBB2958950.1 ABC-2 type transport system permease protein [Pseudoclavibacter helvolus]
MTQIAATGRGASAPHRVPPKRTPEQPKSTVGNGLRRISFELRGYFRQTDQVFFVFLFPLVMFALFASIFSGETVVDDPRFADVTMSHYYLTGMLAMAILLSGMQFLGIDIATEKHEGGLARLGATPLSPVSFFMGKIGLVLITCTLQLALVMTLGVVAFDITLPDSSELWMRFAWLSLLGIFCFASLGIAISAIPRSARSASAIVLPLVLVPQFLSGIYVQFSVLPEWMQQLSNLFPLAGLVRGMRSVFLPDAFAAAEVGGTWGLGSAALTLGVWTVIGLVASLLTFRWSRGRS